MGVHQVVLQHPTHVALIGNLLLSHAVLQIVGCQGQCITTVTIGLTHSQEVHAFLTDIIHAPANFTTDKDPSMRICRVEGVTAFHTIDLVQGERITTHIHTLTFHPDVTLVINDSHIQPHTIPPTGTILNHLRCSSE